VAGCGNWAGRWAGCGRARRNLAVPVPRCLPSPRLMTCRLGRLPTVSTWSFASNRCSTTLSNPAGGAGREVSSAVGGGPAALRACGVLATITPAHVSAGTDCSFAEGQDCTPACRPPGQTKPAVPAPPAVVGNRPPMTPWDGRGRSGTDPVRRFETPSFAPHLGRASHTRLTAR